MSVVQSGHELIINFWRLLLWRVHHPKWVNCQRVIAQNRNNRLNRSMHLNCMFTPRNIKLTQQLLYFLVRFDKSSRFNNWHSGRVFFDDVVIIFILQVSFCLVLKVGLKLFLYTERIGLNPTKQSFYVGALVYQSSIIIGHSSTEVKMWLISIIIEQSYL